MSANRSVFLLRFVSAMTPKRTLRHGKPWPVVREPRRVGALVDALPPVASARAQAYNSTISGNRRVPDLGEAMPTPTEVMPTLKGFGTFAALPEEQISKKVSRRVLCGDHGMLVWWSIGAGVHVEPHSHANEQIVWMLKGKMEFRLGGEQRVCGSGDVVVIPGGMEHEAWFREDTQVIDFFAPPRDDFLVGGKPAYISES